MKKSIVQFHAAPKELAEFVVNVASDLNLYMVRLRFVPRFECVLIERGQDIASDVDCNSGAVICLYLDPPNLDAAGQIQFYELNPTTMTVDIEPCRSTGLRQSTIGFRTSDQAAIALGKEVIKRLKRITMAGVRILTRDGDYAIEKSFRYTAGALQLEREGVQMLSGGSNLIELGT